MIGLARCRGQRIGARVVALALLLAVGWPQPALADARLAKVRAAIENLEYPAARALLDEALASGEYGPAELHEIYLLTGVVTGSLGDPATATAAFRKLLALSPNATLVAGTTPKATRPFAAASAFYEDHAPLRVSTETTTAPPSVTLIVDADPEHMVAGARVWVTVDGQPAQELDAKGTDRIAVALPAGDKLELRVAAIDAHGNRLVELGSPTAIVIAGARRAEPKRDPAAPVATPPRTRPLYARWWLWGGVSVAAAATGTLFGLAARSAGDELNELNASSLDHHFGEAQDVLARGRRDALVTNIAFGVAGASAVAAVLLFITDRPTPRERSIQVAPVPTRGGTAITLEVPF